MVYLRERDQYTWFTQSMGYVDQTVASCNINQVKVTIRNIMDATFFYYISSTPYRRVFLSYWNTAFIQNFLSFCFKEHPLKQARIKLWIQKVIGIPDT